MNNTTPESLDDAVPAGPPRAVVEYWHAEALKRLDDRIVPWLAVAHVAATILAAMNDEADQLAAATARAEKAEARLASRAELDAAAKPLQDHTRRLRDESDRQARAFTDGLIGENCDLRTEVEQLRARIAELGDEWGRLRVGRHPELTLSAGGGDYGRTEAVLNLRHDEVLMRREVTPWRPADATEPSGVEASGAARPATHGPENAAQASADDNGRAEGAQGLSGREDCTLAINSSDSRYTPRSNVPYFSDNSSGPDAEPTHDGAHPAGFGPIQHKGLRENCTAPDCLDAATEDEQ